MNEITLTLGQACMLIIVFFVILLLIYLITLAKNLLPSVKALARVMENVETITESAARSTEKAETVVSDVTDITTSVVHTIKKQTTVLGQVSSIVSAMRVLAELFSREGEQQDAARNDPSCGSEASQEPKEPSQQ